MITYIVGFIVGVVFAWDMIVIRRQLTQVNNKLDELLKEIYK